MFYAAIVRYRTVIVTIDTNRPKNHIDGSNRRHYRYDKRESSLFDPEIARVVFHFFSFSLEPQERRVEPDQSVEKKRSLVGWKNKIKIWKREREREANSFWKDNTTGYRRAHTLAYVHIRSLARSILREGFFQSFYYCSDGRMRGEKGRLSWRGFAWMNQKLLIHLEQFMNS